MTGSTGDVDRAPHYSGQGFPVDKLSPVQFEDFVFACLQCTGDVLGLKITGKPSGSGDGGFDVQGESVSSNRLACIQCKRQETPLGTPQVAEELAKVAATSALEGSDVGEHRFICTGGVRTKLIKQLREESRQELASAAGKCLVTAVEGELATLRLQLEQAGHDARRVAESYVQNLDVLVAWSFHEFDVALSSRWDSVLQVAERYFQIASVVREIPRASFDRAAYVAEHRDFRLAAEPRLGSANLPAGVTASSAADPAAPAVASTRIITTLRELAELETGNLVMLVGDGGVGKSAALKLIRAESLQSNPALLLPVMFSLAQYVPGGLDRAIHQELGVDHGSWRSLPDHIILLCDGLNECPLSHVGAFLDELKSLLKRKRVACIISTRESTGRAKIVLPQTPLACVQVQGITPVGIRRIAEHELGDGTANTFVATYRTLVDISGSPLLWTPFAVMVAVKLWRLKPELPPTLGEMLDVLLRSRCERNAEQSDRRLSPEVILLLAGALAFECLVVERRLEYPAIEAARWIRQAKLRCADALGVADMTEMEVAELLIEHDLLHLSKTGCYSFDHQLIAGALAAPLLSRVWRDYIHCLDDQISDDAWVFAARMIPGEQAASFLTTTFNTDLILGARTARELRGDFYTHALALLDQSVGPGSPEFVRIRGTFALAILGSREAVATLKAMERDATSPILHQVRVALAAAGDQEYLQKLLFEVDQMRSMPFNISGGDVAIWEAAALPRRLDLARHRLSECNPGDPVAESLSLVAFELDSDDAILIEKHLNAATNLTTWHRALYALHSIMPKRAKAIVETTLTEAPTSIDKARVIRTAALAGIEVDIRVAFACAVADLPAVEADRPESVELRMLIADVIATSTLPPDLVSVVERELPSSSGDRRMRLWQLALGCESSLIAEYAASCIEAWNDEAGYACTYFIEQGDLARARRPRLLRSCESGLGNEGTWYDWKAARALALLEKLGFPESAARSLSAMVERLTRVIRAVHCDIVASLHPDDAAVLKSIPPERARFHLALRVAALVPVIASTHAVLSQTVVLSLLQFDLHSCSVGEQMREALSGVSDADIDEILEQIREPWTMLSGLATACPRGPTETRTKLLQSALNTGYSHPAIVHVLCQAIDACWCKSVFAMVLTTVAHIQTWSEYDSQFFWKFTRMVAQNVGIDDGPMIDVAIAEAQTAFAKRILELWRGQASGERIGLLRLSS